MLIRVSVLKQIRDGEITLIFRRWRRPTVRSGGTLKTAVGVLAIEAVDKVPLRGITDQEALAAGYPERSKLLNELRTRTGDVYRVNVSWRGDDPRIELREAATLSDEEFAELVSRLDRFDAASRAGPWCRQTLSLIRDRPEQPAADLAGSAGFDKVWFKRNVRKLKELGLTVSCKTGYTLSPRGRAALERLAAEG